MWPEVNLVFYFERDIILENEHKKILKGIFFKIAILGSDVKEKVIKQKKHRRLYK